MNVFCIFMCLFWSEVCIMGQRRLHFIFSFFPILEIVMSYYWFEIRMLLGDEGLGKSRCQQQAAPKG